MTSPHPASATSEPTYSPILPVLFFFLVVVSGLTIYFYYHNQKQQQPSTEAALVADSPTLAVVPLSPEPTETFSVTDPLPAASFQQILANQCMNVKQESVQYTVIDLQSLPFRFSESFIRNIPTTNPPAVMCSMWQTTNKGSVRIRYDENQAEHSHKYINIYDNHSEEGGHGGYPIFGSHPTIIRKMDDVVLSIELNWPHGGCALIGHTDVMLRGEKEFILPNKESVYINTEIVGIEGEDPRLTALLQPEGEECEDSLHELAIDHSTHPIAKIQQRFFTLDTMENPENAKIQSITSLLNAITLK